MRKGTATRRGTVLAGSALLLLAGVGSGCAESKGELTLQLEYHLGPTEKPAEALLAAHAVVEKRVALVVPDARVLSAEPDRILVQIPELDANTMAVLRKALEVLGSLEFRLVASDTSEAYKTWNEGGEVPPGWTEYSLRALKEEKYVDRKILVSDRCEMSGEHIATARVVSGERHRIGPSVTLSFTAAGEREFARITGDHIGEQLAIVLNTRRSGGRIKEKGTCFSAPVIHSRIFGDAVIEGDFTLEDVHALAAALTSGSLPAPLVFDKSTSLPKIPPRDGAEKKDK